MIKYKSVILFFYATILTTFYIKCSNLLDPSEPGNLVPKTVDEGNSEHSDHTIKFNETIFHIEKYGDSTKPVIIFFHGGPGGDSRSLLRLKDRYNNYSLTDEYYLVFWDQRGSGLSKRHNKEDLTLNKYQEDGKYVIDHFTSSKKPVLIGHSWGGIYVTLLINNYPDKIRGAVFLEPGPFTGDLFERIQDDLSEGNLFSEWVNDLLWNTQFLSTEDHARLDYQLMIAYKESQPSAFHLNMETDPAPLWRASATANIYIQDELNNNGNALYDFTTNLDQFTNKVLFLVSSQNEIVGKDFQENQMKAFQDAELKTIPDCGHNLMWSKPSETIELIRTYLNELN